MTIAETSSSTDNSQFAHIIGPLARAFFGEPTKVTKSELRFGSHGSLAIDLTKGTWYDHEKEEGGGVLDLVERETKLTGPARMEWLRREGYLSDAPRPSNFNVVAEYPYTDEHGTVLFEVCRLDPKDFRQCKPDGNGGWTWSVKGVRRVPYRLHELVEDIKAGRTIFIPEGEKDVNRLRSIGIPATCNAGGANKWHDDLTPVFKGCDAVIIPDNDKAGQDHAAAVAAKLLRHRQARPGFGVVAGLARDAAQGRHIELVRQWRDSGAPARADRGAAQLAASATPHASPWHSSGAGGSCGPSGRHKRLMSPNPSLW